MVARPVLTPWNCIFCGSSKDITREHVIPDWIKKEIPRKHESYGGHSISIEKWGDDVVVRPQLIFGGSNIGKRTLSMVCARCNNGWMSALQLKASPLLKALIHGDWGKFEAGESDTISAWVAMTAAVIAMSTPDKGGVPQDDRRAIYETRSAPPNWRIYAGKCSGVDEMVYGNNTAVIIPLKEYPPKHGMKANSCVTTIAVGQLILQSINIPETSDPYDHVLYAYDVGLFPVYPWDSESTAINELPIIRIYSDEWNRVRNAFQDGFGQVGRW